MSSSTSWSCRRASAVVLLATASGCIDYTLSDYKGGYGTPDDTPFVEDLDSCDTTGDGITLYNLDFRVGLDGNGADSTTPEIITKVTVVGEGDDPYPYRVRVARVPEYALTVWTADLSSDGGGAGNWTAVADSLSELNDVNNVAPDMPWAPIVQIDDDTPGACDDYTGVDLFFETQIVNALRGPPNDSTCSPGSGTFALYPVKLLDADSDDNLSAVFQAVQVSGTGVLTDAAWIREITATETHGATLRVIKAGNPYHFLTNDLLANYSTVSAVVSSQGSSFSTGVISGGAPFVLEEVSQTVDSDFEVQMEWECGSVSQWKNPPDGFEIRAAALDDCTFAFPQTFVIRPLLVMGEPVQLSVYPYGQLGNRVSIDVDEVGGEYQWEYSFLDFHVAGMIDEIDPGVDMTVTLDDISWNGEDICDAGTYVLPLSE